MQPVVLAYRIETAASTEGISILVVLPGMIEVRVSVDALVARMEVKSDTTFWQQASIVLERHCIETISVPSGGKSAADCKSK